jgi:hypothetical protein
LRNPDLSPQDRIPPLNRGRHLLVALLLAVSVTLLGLGAIAVFCQYMVAPIPHGPAFDAQFTVLDGFFYPDQPAKTVAYEAGCVASPFLLALGFFLARRWAGKLSDKILDRLTRTGVVLYLLLVMGCAWPIIYCPHPPFPLIPPLWLILPFDFSPPFCSLARVLLLFVAAGAALYFLASPASRRNANRALILLLTIWAVLIPSRFYLPRDIGNDYRYLYHFNSVVDSLSQSVNGHHLLVNFPHIYGGYAEMLAPLIRLFPRDIGTLVASLALPNVLGMLSLLLTARLVIRRPALLFVCGLALLGVGYLATSVDIFYCYITARFFFPPVGLLAATLYFRHPGALRYATATAIAALAPVWNLDTGLVLWASWLGTLLAMELTARNLPGIARHLLIQALSMAAAWAAFLLYLRLASGQWPDVGMLFYFQKFVVSSGYFCLRMLVPDMWGFVLGIYAIGLAVAFCACVRGRINWLTPVTLMISLLGIGIFSYFMGRSAESNLVMVAYPAVLLAGILCAEGEVLTRLRKLPAEARFFLLPSKLALFWWAFLLVAALPDLLATSGRVARNWRSAEQTPLRADVAFVTQRVRPHEDSVYFLSNHSGIYYYLSDTVRPLKIPGTIELLRAQDMDVLLDAIRARRIGKLFVDQNFYAIEMYRPDIYQAIRDAIAQNYQAAEVGPTGWLVLYTPR